MGARAFSGKHFVGAEIISAVIWPKTIYVTLIGPSSRFFRKSFYGRLAGQAELSLRLALGNHGLVHPPVVRQLFVPFDAPR